VIVSSLCLWAESALSGKQLQEAFPSDQCNGLVYSRAVTPSCTAVGLWSNPTALLAMSEASSAAACQLRDSVGARHVETFGIRRLQQQVHRSHRGQELGPRLPVALDYFGARHIQIHLLDGSRNGLPATFALAPGDPEFQISHAQALSHFKRSRRNGEHVLVRAYAQKHPMRSVPRGHMGRDRAGLRGYLLGNKVLPVP
jgi:hypothetical protein